MGNSAAKSPKFQSVFTLRYINELRDLINIVYDINNVGVALSTICEINYIRYNIVLDSKIFLV